MATQLPVIRRHLRELSSGCFSSFRSWQACSEFELLEDVKGSVLERAALLQAGRNFRVVSFYDSRRSVLCRKRCKILQLFHHGPEEVEGEIYIGLVGLGPGQSWERDSRNEMVPQLGLRFCAKGWDSAILCNIHIVCIPRTTALLSKALQSSSLL